MLDILKNNWNRLLQEKAYLMVSIFLTVCAVSMAILLTNKIDIRGNIALVSKQSVAFEKCKYFKITKLAKKPEESELVQNRYDAIVSIDNGTYKIDTIKNKEFKDMLTQALENPKSFVPNTDTTRKIGTNIIGYIMMFVLMQGVLYSRFFAEDKEKHMIERIAIAPINFIKYLLGHGLFIIGIIFVPSFLVIAVVKVLGISVGFSLFSYAILIGLLAILSTGFGLFINSLFNNSDTPNMLGSSIVILTSILAGSFNSFTKEDTMLNRLLHILPQKDYINFVNAFEKGTVASKYELQLLYVIMISIVMFSFAIIKTKRDYVYSKIK